ncbi:type II toxin-antitoxin system HicB family antitoxin [Microvirga sp. BT291]|nr:type II toxin-antitoxin system HicB family antitoxin [Microvirga pudoricolor]MBM6596210.1 type II toxin-antitoxin system HicB family antitoxin [Microvirga pudoricolor]
MTCYIGLAYKDPDTSYGVVFPDFPGCATAAEKLSEIPGMAEEALALHIAGMVEDGESIPEPSSFEAVMANPKNRDGVPILVAVKTVSPSYAP